MAASHRATIEKKSSPSLLNRDSPQSQPVQILPRFSRRTNSAVDTAGVLIAGGVEAGKVAILFGIFHPAKPLAVLDHGRLAASAPGRLLGPIGPLLFLRPRLDLYRGVIGHSANGLLT